MELLNQMKMLYGTLEEKEGELRDFIRNYEQRMRESDESIKQVDIFTVRFLYSTINSIATYISPSGLDLRFLALAPHPCGFELCGNAI